MQTPKEKQKIKDAIAAKLKQQDHDKLSTSIAAALSDTHKEHKEAITSGFLKLADGIEAVLKATEANEPLKHPATQKVAGAVEVTNPVTEVEVKNPVRTVKMSNFDLAPLRDDINALVRAISSATNAKDIEHKAELEQMYMFMQKLQVKADAELITALKPLRSLSSDPHQPLAVRLSDGEKFYKAVLSSVAQAASNSKLVEDLLTQIEINTREITINIDSLEIGLEDTERLLGTESVHVYGEATIVAATETILLTHTVTSVKDLVRLINVEANANFIFRLKKNGTTIWKWRNAWTDRGQYAEVAIQGANGDVFTVTGENLHILSCEASASLDVYEITPTP